MGFWSTYGVNVFSRHWNIESISSDILFVYAADPQLCGLSQSDLLIHFYWSSAAENKHKTFNHFWIRNHLYFMNSSKQNSFSRWWNQWGWSVSIKNRSSGCCLHLQDGQGLSVLRTIWEQGLLGLDGAVFWRKKKKDQNIEEIKAETRLCWRTLLSFRWPKLCSMVSEKTNSR